MSKTRKAKYARIAITATATVVGILLATLVFGPRGMTTAAELCKGLSGIFATLMVLYTSEQSRDENRQGREKDRAEGQEQPA